MADSARFLEPEVEVHCDACGAAAAAPICTAADLAAQLELAGKFHKVRLRRRSRAALEERALFTHDYATELLACEKCGLLYRSPRPSPSAVLGAYAVERYARERLPQMVFSQRALFLPKARALARRLHPLRRASGRDEGPPRVLEVGSFVGGFLWAAREVGIDAVGLDPSAQLSRLCTTLGLRVLQTTLEERAATGSRELYDAVAIWNTFDQLPRPREVLAAVRRVIWPGGLLVLRFPHGACFQRLVARRWSGRRALAWNNLLGFPYLHGYGLPSLDRLIEPFGFTRIGVRGDVLGRQADSGYARWARLEERAVKAAQRARFRADLAHAPWLDVVLRDAR
ncbi:MAG TPA: methyltransferase domain-containing protein [Myxococcota bacterium]|nr:methyltransferase domain-containing protein [Myxococcota bacterium]